MYLLIKSRNERVNIIETHIRVCHVSEYLSGGLAMTPSALSCPRFITPYYLSRRPCMDYLKFTKYLLVQLQLESN